MILEEGLLLARNKPNLKLILILIDVVYVTKKRISALLPNVTFGISSEPPLIKANIVGAYRARHATFDSNNSATKPVHFDFRHRRSAAGNSAPIVRVSQPLNDIIHLLSRAYWSKHKFDFGYTLNKKNLLFIHSSNSDVVPTTPTLSSAYLILCEWTSLLSYTNKRHRQYKHLIFNTIIKHISGLVFIKSQRSAFLSSPIRRQTDSDIQDSMPHLMLSHFQLRVEFIHFILYFFSRPSFFPYQSLSYFCSSSSLASFASPPPLRAGSSTTFVPTSHLPAVSDSA